MEGEENYLHENGKQFCKICKTLRKIWAVIRLKSVIL